MHNPSAPTSLEVYEALCEELYNTIPSIYKVEKIGDKVYILFREAGRGGRATMHSDVSRIFEEIDRGNEFESTVREISRDSLHISEIDREMLEARVGARVGELTESGTLHGEIESVRVQWTFLSRILRAIRVDSHETHGVITLRDLDMTGFSDRTLLLRALVRDFAIPMSIRGVSPS